MTVYRLFPTHVYSARLRGAAGGKLNGRLLRECRQLSLDDAAGRRWSAKNYPGGYTSYGSAHRMHRLSPTFAALERAVDRHVARFAGSLDLDLAGRELSMTDCWVNIMPPGTTHGLHLHPLSTISGTYYVRTPRGCPGLKLEDPRLERMMAAPPRRAKAARENRPWVVLPAEAGSLLLFESWLRHEVPANLTAGERVSISFNYGWF
ncbi:MAG TPA: TIGR02466 family protein [Steroidobacteraceae bacterium]|nr:TIGR02466 family protein [Steroidobacteraceae bacterium]